MFVALLRSQSPSKMEQNGDFAGHYHFSPSYNLYSFHQPSHYAHGSFTPPAPQAIGGASSLTMAGGTDFVESIGVKVINPDKKNEAKLLTLRNANFHSMKSPTDLHTVIIEQLGSKTVADSTDLKWGITT